MAQATLDTRAIDESGLTAHFTERSRALKFDDLPPDVIERAKQCLLDWLGVTLAGSGQPLTDILRGEVREQGGNEQATLIGTGGLVSTQQAALVNGTASHALDFDDVHSMMSGHPTVPIVPAALALAEAERLSGAAFVTAFVAGFEVECRLGAVMSGHYQTGWHATGTLGTFGAAVASAHLLGLDEGQWRYAMGIAGTQAAGLKSMFGTMCKPFHAGRAAANGLLAASLAARGFTSNPDVLEAEQGFGATQATTFRPELAMSNRDEFVIRDVLFKHHAACFGTHAAINAMLNLQEREHLNLKDVESIQVRVPTGALTMCNIQTPTTALEAKFSLRFTTALAISNSDTTETGFTDAVTADPRLVALRDRVAVVGEDKLGGGASEVTVRLQSGESHVSRADVNEPERNLDREWERLTAKYYSLAVPLLGQGRAQALYERIRSVETVASMNEVTALAVSEVR
jgi:2-methylcitrate dehydratase PrpD